MYEVVIYGGAFNPPHAGHAGVMIEASKQAKTVLVVPSYKHPFGKVMVDYELRMDWVGKIIDRVRPHCGSVIAASNLEFEMAQKVSGPIYSFDLLNYVADTLKFDHSECKKIAMVVGQDVADQLPEFHLGKELLEKFSVITVEEQIGVRSTAMRKYLQEGEALPAHWIAPGLDPINYRVYAQGAA